MSNEPKLCTFCDLTPGHDGPHRYAASAGLTPEDCAAVVDTVDRALSMLRVAETVKKTGGAVEIAGVRIEPCDERGETLTLKAFAAAAEALDRVRELSEEGKCWGGADAIEEFIRRLDEILDGGS